MMMWNVWEPLENEAEDDSPIEADSPRDAALAYAERQCRDGNDDGVYAHDGGHPIAVRLPAELGGAAIVYLVAYVGVPAWPGSDHDPDLVALSQASAADAKVYLRGGVPVPKGPS